MSKTLYEILEVSPNASPETIQTVYRSLMKRFHPDKNSASESATRQTQEINAAYSVLSDPSKRAAYDEELAGRSRSGSHDKNWQSPYDEALDRQAKEFSRARSEQSEKSAAERGRSQAKSDEIRAERSSGSRSNASRQGPDSMAHKATSGVGGMGAEPPLDHSVTSGDGVEKITIHSKINSWITLLFLALVFAVLSSVLSKLAALLLQLKALRLSPAEMAMVSGLIGAIIALVATFQLGRFLAAIIPVRSPLSGILMTRGASELNTHWERTLVTVALIAFAPIVQISGLVIEGLLIKPAPAISMPDRNQSYLPPSPIQLFSDPVPQNPKTEQPSKSISIRRNSQVDAKSALEEQEARAVGIQELRNSCRPPECRLSEAR